MADGPTSLRRVAAAYALARSGATYSGYIRGPVFYDAAGTATGQIGL